MICTHCIWWPVCSSGDMMLSGVFVVIQKVSALSASFWYERCLSTFQAFLLFICSLVALQSTQYAAQGGLIEIQAALDRNSSLDASQLAAILQPFSLCSEYLNRSCVQSYIAPVLELAVTYIRELSEDDFKLKVRVYNLSVVFVLCDCNCVLCVSSNSFYRNVTARHAFWKQIRFPVFASSSTVYLVCI